MMLFAAFFASALAQTQCLTPEQDRDLKTSIMAVDATLKITCTSLDIAAMWNNGTVKEQLQQASQIIGAVDTELVPKMIAITEETCGTCAQITKGVNDIAKALEDTLKKAVPDWQTNPIFKSVVMAVNIILRIVPNFCPDTPAPGQERALFADAPCLTPDQDRTLKTSIISIDTTLKMTATGLTIGAMWQTGVEKEQLQNASRIITAVDEQFVQKMTAITEETCGTCTQVTKGVKDIVTDLENTMSAAAPDWKTNPIFKSVTMVVNMILEIVPNFCPSRMLVAPEKVL